MAEATLKVVAKLAGVAPITVSCVVNGSENVAAATKEKILAIIRDLDYTPNVYAANLRRKRLNNEGPNGSSEGLVLSNKRLSAGCNAMQTSHAHQTSPEERRTLAQEIIRLRKDLDKLMRHTESIQTCMDARPAGLWDLYQDELQVAVSEAPLHSVSTLSSSLMGAPDTALRLHGTNAPRSSYCRQSPDCRQHFRHSHRRTSRHAASGL